MKMRVNIEVMISSVGTSPQIPSSSSSPTKMTVEEAIAQAKQTLSDSRQMLSSGGIGSSPSSTETYSSQMIYDRFFLKALGDSNAAVLSNGKAGVPYPDAKAAIEAGNNAITASKASILYSAAGILGSNSGGGTTPLLQLLYLKNGYHGAFKSGI